MDTFHKYVFNRRYQIIYSKINEVPLLHSHRSLKQLNCRRHNNNKYHFQYHALEIHGIRGDSFSRLIGIIRNILIQMFQKKITIVFFLIKISPSYFCNDQFFTRVNVKIQSSFSSRLAFLSLL